MEADRAPNGVVVLYSGDERHYACEHERATRTGIARRLATLKGFDFGGTYEASARYPGLGLLRAERHARRARTCRTSSACADEHDLFGGVVPFAFVATKALTHPLTGPDARAPVGWSREFGCRVRDAVRAGWYRVPLGDARHAGCACWSEDRCRLKPVGRPEASGRSWSAPRRSWKPRSTRWRPAEVAEHGLVLEEDLTDGDTYSVGQVRVAGLVVTYYGTQRLTRDNQARRCTAAPRLVRRAGRLRSAARAGSRRRMRGSP